MSSSTQVTLSDDNLLAEYVSLEKFKGILEQRVAVGPDLLAMLIKDGQIAQAEPGGHFAIGGMWRTLKDAIGGKHAIRLMIADLKPFSLTTSADSLSKDNVPISGEFTLELQVNPEKSANVLGLMKEHSAVTKSSVLTRLAPHLGDRVLNAAVRRVDALELRGNTGMQDKIQADAMKEVERLLADVGVMVRGVSMRWAFNEEEKAEITKRQKAREQEAIEQDFKILNRSMEREAETTIIRLTSDFDIEKAKVATEDDLRKLILNNELGFIDARETGVRVAQMKALEHELALNAKQRIDGLNTLLEAEDHALAIAKKKAEQAQQRRGEETEQGKHGRGEEIERLKHGVETTKIGGDRRKVELDVVTLERNHDVRVAEIRAQLRVVERSVEDADTRQRLGLERLGEMQRLEIADRAHETQIKSIRGLADAEIEAESRRLDNTIKGGDAEHRRRMDTAKQDADAKIEQMRILATATPEQAIAIQAGFSQAVANVLVEQAKARAAEGADRLAMMREMVQQAKDAQVASADQAKHFFEHGIKGTVGVAEGVGAAVAGAKPKPPAAGGEQPQTVECPGCHRNIPVTDRHCRYCGRQMRQ